MDHAHVTQREIDVFGANFLIDQLQRLLGVLLGAGDMRAVGGPHAQAKLPGIDDGKNVAAEYIAPPSDNQHRCANVDTSRQSTSART